ncbi:FtsK/SpoIIIE domain-containing protein [Streptomyces sp. KL118A]|uniref:FtsK/SpoIIIE domain-containing protein n=1 Tax=Streptomyces sp. KL118A TaxID=3045153 RepID=UPI00278C4DC7|nr:FtsK/SpoIIIE domain-containing protein [Streptomyces sp. KL118A]
MDLGTWLLLAAVAALAGGLVWAKARAPRVYWSLVGLPLAWGRFILTYRSTMEVCGLTVLPTGFRAFMTRNVGRREVRPQPPKVRRVRPTSTGLRISLRLPAGLEPADVAASSERLRHAWGVRSVIVRETRPGVVELRMTGYDVLNRVRMPRRFKAEGPMVVPVALREDGSVFTRDYPKVPHALTLGANQSGKSMYQRNLVAGLARLPVGLIGIDCKRGVEQSRYAPRLSALATTPQEAGLLLDALVGEMEDRFDLLSLHGVSDLWDLPEPVRPVPLVVLVDEVAELFLVAAKKDEAARDQMVMQMIRLAQMARAIGIYLEVCGQRFGSELGRGATTLRAQLTGRVVHRVNDKQTGEMGLGDIAPEAVQAVTTIPPDRPGVAVAGDSSGGWSRVRTPAMTPAQAADICRQFAHLTPDLAFLAPFRPLVRPEPTPEPAPPRVAPRPVTE